MNPDFLLALQAPFIHVFPGPQEALVDFLQGPDDLRHEGLVVRRLRGRKMRSEAALFDECAAALQFPAHFGENWDALDECLNDLEWLDGQAGALVITDAEQLLVEADGEAFGTLLELFQAERDAPMHVLLQVSDAAAEGLLGRLRAQGAVFRKL